MNTDISNDTITVDRNELFSLLREMYLMVCSESFESRDACVEIIGMIEDFAPTIDMPIPTRAEQEAFDDDMYADYDNEDTEDEDDE